MIKNVSLVFGFLFALVACSRMSEPDRSGEIEIRQTWTVDIDSETMGTKDQSDIWYHAVNDSEKYLEPQNGAKLALMSKWRSQFLGCQFISNPKKPIKIEELERGKFVCLKTNLGNEARLEFLGFHGNHMKIKYELWGKNLPKKGAGTYPEKKEAFTPFEPGRMRFIKENIKKIADEQFPDNTHNTWKIWSTTHDGKFTYVKVIPTPNDVGYDSFKFLFYFENDDVGEKIAVYSFENKEYSLLNYKPEWKGKIREKAF